MPSENFIGIDWGSTHARALLFARDGTLVEHGDYPLGIKHVAHGQHRDAFQRMAGAWRARLGPIPTFLSGMIGSRHGWHEVPYLPCPVSVAELSRHLFTVPQEENVFIVPGVKVDTHRADVMRGEELQVLGLRALAPDCDLVCIPGTHSKWITLDGPVVRDFRTAMTGEVFAAITEHTLFAELIRRETPPAPFRAQAFDSGLERSAEPQGLLNVLFEFRASLLLGRVMAEDLPDLISGLLIGTEIRHARSAAPNARNIAVIGASGLGERYAHALRTFGFEPRTFDPREVAARGFVALFN
jgi:2-dehydro-3-deoxygalactonokinase